MAPRNHPPSDQTPHGDAIEALQQELATTNVLLLALGRELQADRVETAVRVEGLRAEQHRERRVRMMAVAGSGVTVLYGYDQHVEHCSPGARVTRGLDYLLQHPPRSGQDANARQQAFAQHYDSASIWCDVTLPLHTHDGSDFPTPGDGIGLGLLALAVLATAVYHRFRTKADFARVREAAEAERNAARDGS